MIILDTHVLSAVMHPQGSPTVVAWLDVRPPGDLAVTSITVAEVFHGIRRLPDGRPKAALEAAATQMFEKYFAGSILPFDHPAALVYSEIVAQRERVGRPISTADAQIAAITHHCAANLATRNVRDFDDLGLNVLDPWSIET